MDKLSKYKKYAQAVINGDIIACNYIKLACQRYLDYFNNDEIYFDSKAADKVVNFISKLKHFTGSHNGKPFILSDWQEWVIYSIYGFKWKSNNNRVVRTVYIEVGRKNGKTALVSALTLYHLIADGEANAQVILAANSAKQAALCFDYSTKFLKPLDPKNKYFKQFRDSIRFDATNSKLHIVAADAKKLDGLNASMFVCDELHEAPNGKVWEVLETSQGMREQPLAVAITTSGFNRSSFCYEMRSSYVEILYGKKVDISVFCAIYTVDEDDDPFTENNAIYRKSNPNLDITIKSDYLTQQLRKAKNNPTLRTSVLTKLFNVWLSSSEQWISADYIMKSQREWDYSEFSENYCYLGIDLGATSDLTCVSVLIPNEGKYYFRNYYFVPQEQLQVNINRDLYRKWQYQGHLTVTNGNVTDYDYILNKVLEINNKLQIYKIGYDQWNATQWAISATEQGMNLIPYSMSIGSLNRPTKDIARLILSDKVVMYPNPIDNFCFENVRIKHDFNDNERPTKESYQQKIDGVMAMIMALGIYISENHYDNSISAFSFA